MGGGMLLMMNLRIAGESGKFCFYIRQKIHEITTLEFITVLIIIFYIIGISLLFDIS